MQLLGPLTSLTRLAITPEPAAGESDLWQQAFAGLCSLVSLELRLDRESGLPFPLTALPVLRTLLVKLDCDLVYIDRNTWDIRVCDLSTAAAALPAPDMCPSVVSVLLHSKARDLLCRGPGCDVAWVCRLTALTSLTLPREAAVSGAALADLRELRSLSASIWDSHTCFPALRALSALRELDLTVDGCADSMACSQLTTALTRLQLSTGSTWDGASMRIHGLAQHSQLVDLRLQSCCIDDSELQALGRLTWLQLRGCSGATGSCLEGMLQLQQLSLTLCPAVTSQILKHLPGLVRLRGIFLGGPGLENTIFKALRTILQLSHIRLCPMYHKHERSK